MERIPASGKENKIESEEQKRYLYHMVPEGMQGAVLHPLNKLREIHPDLYISKAGKYKDRQHVMEQFIPTLACAWNDVLHFTAIHPEDLKKALVEAGMEPREMKFYQIDPNLLNPEQTTIYLYSDKPGAEQMSSENFTKYDPQNLVTHSVLPELTKQYYKDQYAEGEHPLLFIGVPHILHKGSIDISDAPVIVVK